MPGLSFLAKKGWHTSTLKNVERKWIAEQKEDREKKKLAELRRQYDEEREVMELTKQMRQHTKAPAKADRLEWMYQGPQAIQKNDPDQYLLGKPFRENEGKGNLKKLLDGDAPGSTWFQKTNTKAEQFQKVNEDPIFMMKKARKAALNNVLQNPEKMRKIKEAVESKKELKKHKKTLQKLKKKAKKLAKKQKKKEKKRKRSRCHEEESSPTEDAQNGQYRSERHGRIQSQSPIRQKEILGRNSWERSHQSNKSHDFEHCDKHRSSIKREPSRGRDQRRDSDRDRQRGRVQRRNDDRDRSRGRDRHENNKKDRSHKSDRCMDSKRRDSTHQQDSFKRYIKQEPTRDSEKRCHGPREGPVRAEHADRKSIKRESAPEDSGRHNGAFKQEPKIEVKRETYRPPMKAVKRNRSHKMSAEEREKRLAQMSADAETAIVSRLHRITRKRKQDEVEQQRDEDAQKRKKKGSFLSGMQKSAYSLDNDIATMKKRLGSRRHYQQKNANSENFMQRN